MTTPTPTPPPMRRSRGLAAAAAVSALLVLGLAACGSDDATNNDAAATTTSADTGNTTTTAGSEATVVAQGIAFANDLTVAAGQAFVFDNQDGTAHTLTADDGSFDSGTVPGANQSAPITAPSEPGDHPFHCEIHPSMTGTLTVGG